jgi:hypothetical protein
MNKEQIEEMIEGLIRRKKLMTEFIEISQKLECYRLAEKYRQRYFIIQDGILRLRKYKTID